MGRVEMYDGAVMQELQNGTWELQQWFSFEPDEDMTQVARDMLGPKGQARLVGVGYENDGHPHPVAVYHGSQRELHALRAKYSGSRIGRPPKEV